MQSRWKKFIMRTFWPLMPGWPDEGRRIVQSPHLRAFLDRASSSSPSLRRVFNAGAGEGGYSRMLLALPGVQTVVESDFGWRSQPPSRFDPRQRFFCSSLDSIPTQSRNFDLVFCTEVLEHVEQHDQALDEIARILAPGGWLLISVPTPPAEPDPNHVREGYRPEELQRMLSLRGFEVLETRFCMHFFFRWLLRNFPRLPWCPRILIRTLSYADRLLPIGPPMDLLILARLAHPAGALPSSTASGAQRSAQDANLIPAR